MSKIIELGLKTLGCQSWEISLKYTKLYERIILIAKICFLGDRGVIQWMKRREREELDCNISKEKYNTLLLKLLLLLLSRFNHVWLCATPETAAHEAPPSLGFSRQEHWSGLPFPSLHGHIILQKFCTCWEFHQCYIKNSYSLKSKCHQFWNLLLIW